MKVLSIGDIHFKASNVREAALLTDSLVKIVYDRQPDLVVFQGDQHHSDRVAAQASVMIAKLLHKISWMAPIKVLIGNHEMLHNQQYLEDVHSMYPFKLCPKIDIVDMPLMEGEFVFMPYVPVGRFIEALDTLPNWRSAKAIFAHQEFYDADFGAFKSETGDRWPIDYPPVISGHIHKRQWLQKNIFYVGTPMQETFAESYDKTVTLFDFDAGNSQNISTNMPKKIQMSVNIADFDSIVFYPENLYKIEISGSQEDIEKFRKTRQKDISLNIKVIFNSTDKVNVVRPSGDRTKTYMEILADEVKNQTPLVKEAFEEIRNGTDS